MFIGKCDGFGTGVNLKLIKDIAEVPLNSPIADE